MVLQYKLDNNVNISQKRYHNNKLFTKNIDVRPYQDVVITINEIEYC